MRAFALNIWRLALCCLLIGTFTASSAIAGGYEKKIFLYDGSYQLLDRGDGLNSACKFFWGDVIKKWPGNFSFSMDSPQIVVHGQNGSPIGPLDFGVIYCPVRVYGNCGAIGYNEDGSCACVCTPHGHWQVRAISVVDVYSQPPIAEQCPLPASPKFGNPIYPSTGSKREVLATDLSLAGSAFVLTYDSQRALLTEGNDLREFERNKLRDFGRYWTGSLHRKLIFHNSRREVAAVRGDGSVVSFVGPFAS